MAVQTGIRRLARRLALTRDVFRPLVFAKAKINGMAHLARARPFGELNFRDELRLDPGRYCLVFGFFSERRFCSFKLYKFAMKFFQHLVAEARTDMADISPAIALAQCQRKSAEEGPRSSRSSEAG